MLLARVRRDEATSTATLRGAFAAEDAWLATGDLFRRDPDGDYWRVDSIADVIRTAEGPVFTAPIRNALGDLAGGRSGRRVRRRRSAGPSVSSRSPRVTIRAGRELDARDLSRGLRHLERGQRPAIVRVVDRIPVTTWFRPMTAPLREEGIPEPGNRLQAWYLDAAARTTVR